MGNRPATPPGCFPSRRQWLVLAAALAIGAPGAFPCPAGADDQPRAGRATGSGRRYLLQRAERARRQQQEQDIEEEARRVEEQDRQRRWDAWWQQRPDRPR